MAKIKKVKKAFIGAIAAPLMLNRMNKKGEKMKEDLKTVLPLVSGAMGGMKKGGKVTKAKAGKQMIKRADGSYSQRGLWDNIRANKGSGKKPTAAMLKQEKKIKAKSKK